MAEGLHLVPTVVAINLFPRVARGMHFDYTAMVFRSVTFLFAIICVATIPLAGPAIDVLFGPQFAGVREIYYWMLPAIFCYGTLNVLSYHFAGRGYPLEAVLIWFPGFAINIAIVMIWVPGSGPNAAALAASVACAVVLVLHMHLFAKESGSYRVLIPRPAEVFQLLVGALRTLRPKTGA
jgi:O-antigen/teichoic acid export membrane protein